MQKYSCNDVLCISYIYCEATIEPGTIVSLAVCPLDMVASSLMLMPGRMVVESESPCIVASWVSIEGAMQGMGQVGFSSARGALSLHCPC